MTKGQAAHGVGYWMRSATIRCLALVRVGEMRSVAQDACTFAATLSRVLGSVALRLLVLATAPVSIPVIGLWVARHEARHIQRQQARRAELRERNLSAVSMHYAQKRGGQE